MCVSPFVLLKLQYVCKKSSHRGCKTCLVGVGNTSILHMPKKARLRQNTRNRQVFVYFTETTSPSTVSCLLIVAKASFSLFVMASPARLQPSCCAIKLYNDVFSTATLCLITTSSPATSSSMAISLILFA